MSTTSGGPIAIFGPTGVGKTGVAISLARLLEERGEHAVVVNCDAIQVYRGLEVISGAADAEARHRVDHRLLSFVPLDEEFSAGRYARLAHREIDALLAEGSRPLVVGGTGLYLRAALCELDMRRPVEPGLRSTVEAEIAERGAEALHAELPEGVRARIHPNDRKRISRTTELMRSGQDPAPDHEGGGQLWTANLRHPGPVVGLMEHDDRLSERIHVRVAAMDRSGAGAEARRALAVGCSRTARAAIGFEGFLVGDLEAVERGHRRFARRQMTWMRRMPGVELVERGGRSDEAVAREILGLADISEGRNAAPGPSG